MTSYNLPYQSVKTVCKLLEQSANQYCNIAPQYCNFARKTTSGLTVKGFRNRKTSCSPFSFQSPSRFYFSYRSQLHKKEKAKVSTKSSHRIESNAKSNPINKKIKTRTKDDQVCQEKSKISDEKIKTHGTIAKAKKSPRIAAQFDNTTVTKDPNTVRKEKLRTASGNALDNSSALANENVAFVTKSNLTSLLKALTNEDVSTLATKSHPDQHLTSAPANDKPVNEVKESTSLNQNTKQETNQPLDMLKPGQNSITNATTMLSNNVVSTTASMEITKPTAMRSSFAIGAPGLVISDPYNDKIERHKQWRKDLEEQIHAKREKEQQLKKLESSSSLAQFGTDQNTGHINTNNKGGYTMKTVGESSQQQEQIENLTDRHGRGRGLMSMMVSTEQADKQRQKMFEHQKAIEQQVEDRRRQKQEEMERRLKEDALEEARLAKETAELQRQFEQETRKNKEKEEQAKNRVHLLQEGISKAHESAQQLKREKRRNRLQASISEEGDTTSRNQDNQTQQDLLHTTSSYRTVNRSVSQRQEMVPSLNLSRSYSTSDNGLVHNSYNIASTHFIPKLKQNTISEREVRTSYSEPISLRQSHDILCKWAEEDVGSCSFIDDQHHVYDETTLLQPSGTTNSEFIPFLRTTSATLLSDSVSSQDNETDQSKPVKQNSRYHQQSQDKRQLKKDRLAPQVQPTRTSLLRSKGTDNEVKKSNRLHQKVAEPSKIVSKQNQKETMISTTTISLHDDHRNSITKEKTLFGEENKTRNSSNYTPSTPTAHQEKFLEQLSTLRKGLMMKDQELMARIFSINEYEIPT